MIRVALVWKLVKRPKWRSPVEIDITSGKSKIVEYEANYVDEPKTGLDRVLDIVF